MALRDLARSRRIGSGSVRWLLPALLGLGSVSVACDGGFGPLDDENAGAVGVSRGAQTPGTSGASGAPGAAAGAGGAAESAGTAGATTGGSSPANAGAGNGAAGAALSLDAGVPPPTTGGAPVPPVICDALNLVFKTSCGGGSCHTSEGAVIGDWGFSAASAAKYVDKPSVHIGKCGNIIDSSDYSKSFMLIKLTGPIPDECGGPMPVGSYGGITPDQIDCVASWLQQFQK